MVQLHKNFIKICKVDSISHHDVKTRFPSDINDVRAMIMDEAHSIMKNFPVQRVFNRIQGKYMLENKKLSDCEIKYQFLRRIPIQNRTIAYDIVNCDLNEK